MPEFPLLKSQSGQVEWNGGIHLIEIVIHRTTIDSITICCGSKDVTAELLVINANSQLYRSVLD
jgi:hypothetical protein